MMYRNPGRGIRAATKNKPTNTRGLAAIMIDQDRKQAEAIQVAAMAIRFVTDICEEAEK